MKLNDFITVSAKQAEEYIFRLWEIFVATGERQTIYLESPPGCGKTSIVLAVAARIAASMGRILVDSPVPDPDTEFGVRTIHLTNQPEETVAGLPWVFGRDGVNPKLLRAMDAMWPQQGMGICMLDEAFQAPYGQRFSSQLTSEGRFGDYWELGAWLLVLCGNSAKDRAGTQRIWTHAQNRIMHLVLKPDVESATAHFRQPCTPEIGLFLRWFGQEDSDGRGKLIDFHTSGGPFASPRTWDRVNSLVASGFDPAEDFPAFQGYLGTKTAMDLKVTFQAVSGLPNLDDMLASPEEYRHIVEVTAQNNPAALCAMSAVFLRRWMAERDEDVINNALTLVQYGSIEHAAAFVAVCEQVDRNVDDGKSIYDTPAYVQYMARNAHITAN